MFANLVLADEINRAAPKTQSALLEAMAEGHVTVAGQTHPLEDPFLVVATQNPIEQEGTYPLPEAQLDRFMMQIMIDYPTPAQEEEILMKTSGAQPPLPAASFDRAAFLELRNLVWSVPVPQSVAAYAVGAVVRGEPADGSACEPAGEGLRGVGRGTARVAESGAGGEGAGAAGRTDGADGGGYQGSGHADFAAPDFGESPGRG